MQHDTGRRIPTRGRQVTAWLVGAVVVAEAVATPFVGQGLAGRRGVTGGYVPVGDLVVDGCIVAIALLLTTLRPRNAIGWLLLTFAALGASQNLLEAYGVRAQALTGSGLPLGRLALSLGTSLWVPAFVVPSTLLLNLYPDGRAASPRLRLVNQVAVIAALAAVVALGTSHSVAADDYTGAHQVVELPAGFDTALGIIALVTLLGCVVLSLVSAVRRAARARPPERQQLLLLLTSIALLVPLGLLGVVTRAIGLVLVPIAVGVGVLRYRLLGVEVIVRRTLLYGVLTGLVVAVYAATTAAVSAVVPSGPAPSVVAAGLVAVLLVPLRDRLQSAVDRVVYGARRDPLGAIRRVGASMSTATTDPLPAVVAAVAASIRATYAGIIAPDGTELAAVGVASPGRAVARRLAVGGETLGDLVVCPAAGELTLSPADARLVETLAVPVAVVTHAVGLAQRLGAAHEQALSATSEERARIRRDLHDGLGPSLSGVALGLEAVEAALPADPALAGSLTAHIRHEVRVAVEEVRRIIDELRPAVLDENGLVGALQDRAAIVTARSTGLIVTVQAPDPMPPLPPEVELAAYRIADEAIANVIRHAGATQCVVRISVGDGVAISVTDDGVGPPSVPRPGGVGLSSMRQRAADLRGVVSVTACPGGGTVVEALLPLRQAARQPSAVQL